MRDASKRLDANQARKLVRLLLVSGRLTFSSHARAEMKADDLTEVDVVNVARGGQITEAPEEVNGTWRYRLHTARIWVVVAFRSETELVVVTAWRKR